MNQIERMTWRLHNITRMVEARRELRDWLTAAAFGAVGLVILMIAENAR